MITLKSAGNYMVKLTISHAIAQSVKMTLFEGLIENTINATKNIPQTMAETGKVPMSRYGYLNAHVVIFPQSSIPLNQRYLFFLS